MKNKGFTLAELMGVIVILGILLLLIVPNVVKSIKDSKQKIYNTQVKNIKMALENWKNDHNTLLPKEGEAIYLTIDQLKRDNYIENDIKNPLTKKMWPNDMLLRIQNTNGYQYEVLTNTGTEIDEYTYQTPTISFDTGDVVILDLGSTYVEPIVTLNSSDGTSKILTNIPKTVSGSGNTVQTTYAGVYQVEYSLTIGGIPIKAIHNVIVRDLQDEVESTDQLLLDTTLYSDGTAVYFNPNTGKKCTQVEAAANVDATTSLPTNVKNGCMKWYTFGDKVGETEVRLILDHNTTALVSWNSTNGNTVESSDITTAFNNDVIGWKKNIRKTARLITIDEIAHIVGADSTLRWSSKLPYVTYNQTPVIGENSWNFYLDGASTADPLWKTAYARNTIKSAYHWLYDYTYGGTTGCETPDDNTYSVGNSSVKIYGYWTSTPATSYVGIWVVEAYGDVLASNVASNNYGIRPVITISKGLIK